MCLVNMRGISCTDCCMDGCVTRMGSAITHVLAMHQYAINMCLLFYYCLLLLTFRTKESFPWQCLVASWLGVTSILEALVFQGFGFS